MKRFKVLQAIGGLLFFGSLIGAVKTGSTGYIPTGMLGGGLFILGTGGRVIKRKGQR